MADLFISNRSNSCDNFWCCAKDNYQVQAKSSDFIELIHSKSDDLILQSASSTELNMVYGISDVAIQIQKNSNLGYGDIPTSNSDLLSTYYSDNDVKSDNKCNLESKISALKLNGCLDDDIASKKDKKDMDALDKVDPENSIKDMISKNDFYRFVLFKKHYEEYLDISQKYEEAKSISYYLEEKYHEVKNERDSLILANKELEEKLGLKDIQLHDKEEELFRQLEKVFRLEEDCEKLRKEKEKIKELAEQLQKDKNEIYKQLRLQTDDSENQRRYFEKTRNEIMRQLNEIALEKNNLEKENTELKETVGDFKFQLPNDKKFGVYKKKNYLKLEQQMTDLKVKAKQSATLNSQLKKGMKHLATCRRKKCSVCAYTRVTFGEYSNNQHRQKSTVGCFPFQERQKHPPNTLNLNVLEDSLLENSLKMSNRLSQCSFSSIQSYVITPTQPSIPYIDECSITHDSDDENDCKNSSHSSIAGHGFYSDSGFSSELCDSSLPQSKSNSIRRSSPWTTSFRKLIRRVSTKKSNDE